MKLIRLILTVALLLISGQSQALFMPDGFQVKTYEPVEANDGAC